MPIYKRRVLPEIGDIKMFAGDQTALARELLRGWAVADGLNGTLNLIDRFPKFDTMAKKGQAGGAKAVTPGGSVSVSVSNHTLTTAQMPSHSHTFGASTSTGGSGYPQNGGGQRDMTLSSPVDSQGGGGAHNHAASAGFGGNSHTNEPQHTVVVPLQYIGF